ncbi:accessory factor associated with RNA polymerase II [Xylographa bjoerkii]|nr:accessory factor associated with RNA polymerase II [Xylographa bjoerkii]
MQSLHDFRTRTPPLSQVVDQSYFRKWALRAAKQSSSEEVSPLTFAASPGAALFQGRTGTTVARAVHGSPLPTFPARPPLINRGPYTRRSSSLDVQIEDLSSVIPSISTDNPASHKTRSSTGSAKSSASSRAPNTLPYRRRRLSLSTPSNDQHARGNTGGRRWKREISSHLIELRVTRKAPQDGSFPIEDLSESTSANRNRVNVQHGYGGVEIAGSTLQGSGIGTASSSSSREKKKDRISSPHKEYPEGLYCRVRRRLGLKKGQVLFPSGEKTLCEKDKETEMMLKHAAELLRDVPDHKSTLSSLSTSTSKLSIAAIHDRKRARSSATSSLRNLFMSREPLPTPDSAALYTGSDNEQYFRVEMSSPEAPSFLPSEARRVGTPPLPRGAGSKRPLRGFFFDFRPPKGHPDTKSPSWGASTASGKSSDASGKTSGNSDHGYERDWFRVQVQTNADRNNFELDVPDHLPNSPLCARNPKHISGGKGICPYHGRARRSSTQASDSTIKTDKAVEQN